MKTPLKLARRILVFAAALAFLAAFQACQNTGPGGQHSTAPFVFEFHYNQPTPVPLAEAQKFLAILAKHSVRGKLTLNGVSVPLPTPKIKTVGVSMALETGGHDTNGNWKTQLVGLLEADSKKDLNAALKEFANSH